MTGHISWPACVTRYSTCRAGPLMRSTMPARSSSLSRCDSRLGDMSGMPRLMSTKRRLPRSSSRTTSGVQRSASTSHALATGQNWPYPENLLMDANLRCGRGGV
jgi:hypothetical protein